MKKQQNKEFELYSFDIFDTLITRKVAKPVGIFVLLREILKTDPKYADIPSDVKENFIEYRTNAEYYTRKMNKLWHNSIDTTFESIYEYFKVNFNIAQNKIEKIKALELAIELDNVVPVKENVKYLKSLIENGKRVVLISDMYLPENIIKQMLLKADPVLCQVKLYLSSTLGFMKSSGMLYEYVHEQEQVEYKNWQHIGDNKKSDYRKAKDLKIHAVLYPYISLKPYEENLLKFYLKSPVVQLAIGCAKNLRLNSFKTSLIAQLGASLAAPILYSYVDWLLSQSLSRGITRLYFIARDGYILKQMADVIIKNKNLKIETNYIYGSRKAWRLSAQSLNDDKLYFQFIHTALWSSEILEYAFNITKKELKDLLPVQLKNYSDNKKVDKLKEYLLKNKKILEYALQKNSGNRNNAINYLKQNIDVSDANFAFVDLSGSGFTQNCLAALMRNFYAKPIETFYYGLTISLIEPLYVNCHSFTMLRKPLEAIALEVLARAPHGQTSGYYDGSENYKPILEPVSPKFFEEWGFNEYIDAALSFTNTFCNYLDSNMADAKNQVITDFYRKFIYSNIDKETANILGDIVHGMTGKETKKYAPSMNIIKALIYLFTNKIDTGNINFSKARSHKLIRDIISYRQTHKSLRKELINLYINKTQKEAVFTILGINISFRHLLWGKEK